MKHNFLNKKETYNNPNSLYLVESEGNTSQSIYNPSYSSVKSDISIKMSSILFRYFDMAYVASIADDSFVLGAPIKVFVPRKNLEEANLKYENDLKFTREHFKKNLRIERKLNRHVALRSVLFDNIREVYPDFGLNMDSKISSKDFSTYKSNKSAFRRALSQTLTYSDSISQSESLLKAQDTLSEVVDNISFSKACDIEDKFFISEIDTFFEKLKDAPIEIRSKLNKNTIPFENNKKISTVDLVHKLKQDRLSRIKKYSEIFELYEKLNKKSDKQSGNNLYIKLQSKSDTDIEK